MKLTRAIVVGFAVCMLAVGFAGAGGVSADEAEAPAGHQFIGAKKCKMCHNSAKQGKIFDAWMESAHSKAYETLASDASKAAAKELGIDDPQKADACLKCHVTGHGAAAELLGKKYDVAEGVGCWANTAMGVGETASETVAVSVGITWDMGDAVGMLEGVGGNAVGVNAVGDGVGEGMGEGGSADGLG